MCEEWFEDDVETDGAVHTLTFNWVTEGKVESPTGYDMPGPYNMAAKVLEGGAMTARNRVHDEWWTTIESSVRAKKAKIRWVIAKGRAKAEAEVEKNHDRLGM